MVTMVSYYPLPFDEFVGFVYPSRYYIPASDGKHPQFLKVEDAFYLVPNLTREDAPQIRIIVPAQELAQNMVNDFRSSSMYTGENAYPAVFYVPESVDEQTLLKKYTREVSNALEAQKRWFIRLVMAADDAWAKTKQHRMISDIQRMAANILGYDREWLRVIQEVAKCPGCGFTVSPSQAICGNCKCIINPELYKTLKFADA